MWMVTADVKVGAERLVLPSFLLKTFFGEGQNALLTSPTLLWNEWRVFVLARLDWLALTAGLRCKPPARARGISPGSLLAHGKFFVGHSQGANSDRE